MAAPTGSLARPCPVVACIDHSRALSRTEFDGLIGALQVYVDEYVVPVWGTPCELKQANGYLDDAWALVFLDDADHLPFARHDLTPTGRPHSKVFVRTSERDGFSAGLSASHELVEMLVDPGLNLFARHRGTNVFYSYEVADPVEDHFFEIDGHHMSDFVYPAYFEDFHAPGSVKFDELGLITEPFGLAPGGYHWTFTDGLWKRRDGSTAKEQTNAARDRRGRRGAQRTQKSDRL